MGRHRCSFGLDRPLQPLLVQLFIVFIFCVVGQPSQLPRSTVSWSVFALFFYVWCLLVHVHIFVYLYMLGVQGCRPLSTVLGQLLQFWV